MIRKKEKYFGISHRISQWKLDSHVENWLSFKADSSDFWQKIYLVYYNIFDHKYHQKGLSMAETAILNHKSSEKISDIRKVVRDMIYCLHRFGFSFQDYCIYNFVEKKDIEYRMSFVGDKLRYHYCDILNSVECYKIMQNKYDCFLKYARYYKRDVIGCTGEQDIDDFIKFTSHHSSFIYKPSNSHSGHGIEIVQSNEINPKDYFYKKLGQGNFVVEELVEQGTETAQIHPSSLNTCRVVTFTIGKNVHIIGTTWRIGCGGAITDNAGNGGMYAAINPETGIVETAAINYTGEHFDFHPNSGMPIIGYHLPAWNEALNLIKEIATTMNGATLIAWDIAYSKKGWMMVEANENGDWPIVQSNRKIGLKNMLFTYMDKYFEEKSVTKLQNTQRIIPWYQKNKKFASNE